MVLSGTEYKPHTGVNPCTRIDCVREMGVSGEEVQITDTGFSCFNGTFRIKSFGWNLVQKIPLTYDWILEVEDTEK